MANLIEALGSFGFTVTVDGDHKTKEVSVTSTDGSTIIINSDGEAKVVRKPSYYIGIMWGCTEPSISDRFDNEEARDAELKRMLDPSHEDSIGDEDAFFAVHIDEDGNCDLGAYTNSEVESMQAGEE